MHSVKTLPQRFCKTLPTAAPFHAVLAALYAWLPSWVCPLISSSGVVGARIKYSLRCVCRHNNIRGIGTFCPL